MISENIEANAIPAAWADVPPMPHGPLEDAYAMFVGTILLSLGLMILAKGGLVTGGVAGLALILSYLTGLPVGLFLVLFTFPIALMAWRPMGGAFAIKTMVATVCLFVMTWLAPHVLRIVSVDRVAAAIIGGSVIGMGALALARHGAATGGSGVIVLWLYRKRGWNAGRTQLVIDGSVLALSPIAISPDRVAWSLLGLVATAGILFVWHRPGRYIGY